MKKTVSDLGEKTLLKRLSRHLGRGSKIIRTFSEDCAVIDAGGPNYLLYTVDAFVEGIHWKREYAPAYLVGRKALAVNVSDISAMGGRPLYYLLSLMTPPETEVSWIDELYRGLNSVSRETGVKLIGGNVACSDRFVVDLFVAGEVRKRRAVFRNGAQCGDVIFVSGELGASAAGLQLLQADYRVNTGSRDVKAAIKAHLDPPLRHDLAQKIGPWVTSMIDLSDGLAADLHEICRESHVGAVILSDKIPVAKSVLSVLSKTGKAPLSLALGGGEDYELLFTVSRDRCPVFLKKLNREMCRVYEVGTIVEKARGIMLMDASGAAEPLHGGYEHFVQQFPDPKE
jgi:thiamine-monophosphate kinase